MDSLNENPFAALFPSIAQAEQFANVKDAAAEENHAEIKDEIQRLEQEFSSNVQEKLEFNLLVEQVFLITLDKVPRSITERPQRCVFLEELYEMLDEQEWIDTENLEQAIFERLMLQNAQRMVVQTSAEKSSYSTEEVAESLVLRYLYQSFRRTKVLVHQSKSEEHIDKFRGIIVNSACTAMQNPDIYPEQQLWKQFLDLFFEEYNSSDSEVMIEFFDLVVQEINSNFENCSISQVFTPCFNEITEKLLKNKLLFSADIYPSLDFISFFTQKPFLAEALIKHSTPPSGSNNGKIYEKTLFGALFATSCVPQNPRGPFEFFNNVSRTPKQEVDIIHGQIWQATNNLTDRLYQVIYAILKLSPECKHLMLQWIGNCMHANAARAKLWSAQMMPMEIFNSMYASDGFFINLCIVLLRLCQRFSRPLSPDLLKIQPTYCICVVSSEDEARVRGIHMKCDSNETCLIPLAENEVPNLEDSYNFITECFFLTQYCMNIGFHVLFERFMKLNQDLHRLQSVYQDVMSSGASQSDAGRRIQQQFEMLMSNFLSVKAALSQPQLLDMGLNLNIATATWLSNLAVSHDLSSFQEVTFPLPGKTPLFLGCVPEYIITNMADLMLFTRKFRDQTFESAAEQVSHVMTWILVFMGSPERMKNPHLRARLAQALEDLMPESLEAGQGMGLVANYHREKMFTEHPLVKNIGPVLLHVFVSIEMTGQSVEFEQKFNYRRPMYKILDYIWKIDIHKEAIKQLALEAEQSIEAADAPLFLRFINLLINDAIFMLDEALSYMSQIKEKQGEQEHPNNENFTPQQRAEREGDLRQLSMLARFHNIQGRDTIHSLELLTQEITSIFTHSVMVDRIAAMLNYFLLHLVGPKKRNLKVKNFDEFDFKPQLLVSDICQLYLNLGENQSFCLAVVNDGRSYSKDLFPQAERVLEKINRTPEMRVQFAEFGQKIQFMASQSAAEEESLGDVPEEFLDSIMGTLMKDPVLLPSSRIIVDRSTIARHLLSDQTDPFNRSPLSMDMVHTDTELLQKINAWLETKKQ